MVRILLVAAAAALLMSLAGPSPEARADRWGHHPHTRWDRYAYWHAMRTPWHAPYYHTQYGAPVALVVPPTAAMQTDWRWGVTGTEMTPIHHQFGRSYPGEYVGEYGDQLRPTPRWPSHTNQFGVYYIRGPW